MLFFLKKLIAVMVLPPVGPLLLAAVGLLLARSRRRGWRLGGFALAWSGIALLFALSLPVVSRGLSDSLGGEVLSPADIGKAQAIVVLAGGKRRNAPEYGGVTIPKEHSLVRLRYGAHLQRQTGLPLLLSGGAPGGGEAEATAMARALHDDYGLDARWVETQSLDTRDNADYSAKMLAAADIHSVLLVTERFHMKRAQAEFERAGLKVIAAPTLFPEDKDEADILSALPSMGALRESTLALHEWLGILAQRLR